MRPHRIIIVSKGADLSLNSPFSILFVVLQILGDFINSLTAGVLFAIIVQTALSTSEFYVFIFFYMQLVRPQGVRTDGMNPFKLKLMSLFSRSYNPLKHQFV